MLSHKIIFNSHIHRVLFIKGYKSVNKPNGISNRQILGGLVSESEWFKRQDKELDASVFLSGAKILDQPITVECNNLDFQTWDKFSDIPQFDTRLMDILTKMGHLQMSPIQKNTFDILNRQLIDLLGSAETGSGKTLAFLVPILNRILSSYPKTMMEDLQKNQIQSPMMLVMAPTRELVQQISAEAKTLLQLTSLSVCDVIGGVEASQQIQNINNGCHSVIATPGRFIDLLSRRTISLKYCTNVILDEADRMLDMGFEPQIRQIMTMFDLPSVDNRQTSMFSATFPNDVMSLAEKLLKTNYGKIMVGSSAGSKNPSIPSSITQRFILCDRTTIYPELFKLFKAATQKKTIVFCNTKHDIEIVERLAIKREIDLAVIHGDLPQKKRSQQMECFKRSHVMILVATSVAARGIDVADVERVINFGIPLTKDDYVHRVGRCGRMGRPGEAVSLVTSEQLKAGSISRDLVHVLQQTNQNVPDFLHGIAPGEPNVFRAKKNFRQRFYR